MPAAMNMNLSGRGKWRLRRWLPVFALASCAGWGLVFDASAQSATASEVLLQVRRYEIVGDNPLTGAEADAVLAPHLGEHRSLGTIEAAANALEARLRERGYSFHRVIVPAQKPAEGVVRLQVLRFPLATVQVSGNRHFSVENVRRSLPGLLEGASPDVNEISADLGLANDHPSKQVSIVLKESTRADALDAEVRVRDNASSQWFLALAGNSRDHYNVINDNTGYTRLTLGYQNTNLMDRDHALTVTYTTSPDHADKVKQYGAFYWLPIYGYATSVQAYYTRSDVNTGNIGLGALSLNVSGRGEFAGIRVTRALARYGDISHNVSLSYDDRKFSSNSDLSGLIGTQSQVQSRPVGLRYALRYEQLWGGVSAQVEHLTNVPGGSNNHDNAYFAARSCDPDRQPCSTRDWRAMRYGVDASFSHDQWNFTARVRGQRSDQMLIQGEQFGLGGAQSVRGLRDREFIGDTGYTVQLEAAGPQVATALRPVAFVDHGRAWLRHAVLAGTTIDRESVASVGVGARWNPEPAMAAAFDLAYVINGMASTTQVAGTQRGDVRFTFNLFYRF